MTLILSPVRYHTRMHIDRRICHLIPRKMPRHRFSYPLAHQSSLTHIIEKAAQAPCDVRCVIPINVDADLIRFGWHDLITETRAHTTCTNDVGMPVWDAINGVGWWLKKITLPEEAVIPFRIGKRTLSLGGS